MLRFRQNQLETWAIIQARMVRETQEFIENGLRHPEQRIRIPAIPVGQGRFARGFAQVFWSQMLGTP